MQILKNETLDNELSKKGYVVIPFLPKEKLELLKQFFYDNHASDIPGFYATAHVPDIGFRQKMNDKIKDVYAPFVQATFTNCEALGGAFISKSNLQKERLQPHQDWNIVDETKYRSFNIWVPLVDLNEDNGAIRVIPESHLWFNNFRGPNIPEEHGKDTNELWDQMTTLPMKAGEALIYDHRLFHSSYPNTTDELRLATVFGIKPAEAQMYYYFGNNGNIEVYESSVDFFMKGDIQNGNKELKLVDTLLPNPQTVSQSESKSSFWDKLTSFWK